MRRQPTVSVWGTTIALPLLLALVACGGSVTTASNASLFLDDAAAMSKKGYAALLLQGAPSME